MTITLQKGSKGEEVKLLQKALNELGGLNLIYDGDFGPGTEKALRDVQTKLSLKITGVYTDTIDTAITKLIDKKYVRTRDIAEIAKSIKIEPAALLAITSVESDGSGFLPDGRCVILFERHIFYREIVKRFGERRANELSSKYPNICFITRSQTAYFGKGREWERLNQARNIDAQSALLSASWGMFQIMGFNFSTCGYKDVGKFVADMCESEKFQIQSVANFIKNTSLLFTAAQRCDWEQFARYYNGPAYMENNYHVKLKNAYNSFKMFN